MLSMTTDYANVSTGCPEPYLRRIAEAGFSHVHWCHHWNTDFLYSNAETGQIARWLSDFGLALTDLHASAGVEKGWCSAREYERQAGIELVRNRLDMTRRLGADVIILHVPLAPEESVLHDEFWARLRRSLDELEPFSRGCGVRIALENSAKDNFDALERIFELYGPEFVGLCYDSGHGNIAGNGLERLDGTKGRLLSLHLHDNDGASDQHRLPFEGTVDWPRLARIIAASPYGKPISMESNLGAYPKDTDEGWFLDRAFQVGMALSAMVGEGRRVAG